MRLVSWLRSDEAVYFDRSALFREGLRKTTEKEVVAAADRGLRRENVVRYWRLKRDIRWAQSRLRKRGLTDDQIHDLLWRQS